MSRAAAQAINRGYRPLRTSVDLCGDAIRTTRAKPPLDLQPYVMEFWEYRVDPAQDYVPVQVFPNGCLSIRFNIRAYGVEPILYGPSVLNNMKGLFYSDWTIFGAALWPARSYQLLGLSVDEIRDLRIHLDCIWPHKTSALCEQMQIAEDMSARIEVLSTFLRDTLRADNPPQADFLNAYHELVKHAPHASDIGLIVKESGTSNRSLRRHFHKYLGLGPKQMHRLIKVQHALKSLTRCPRQDLAQLSATVGFSDQAHFNRCFRQFVGLSPGRFASLVGTMHDKELDIWAGLDPRWRDEPTPKVIRFT